MKALQVGHDRFSGPTSNRYLWRNAPEASGRWAAFAGRPPSRRRGVGASAAVKCRANAALRIDAWAGDR